MTNHIGLKRLNQGMALTTDTLALPPLVIEGLEEFNSAATGAWARRRRIGASDLDGDSAHLPHRVGLLLLAKLTTTALETAPPGHAR